MESKQTITLGPGESKELSFEATPGEARTYTVSINGLTGTFRAIVQTAADIRVEDLTITPSEVTVGEKVIISVLAKNYGNATGTKTITCTVS